MQHASDRYNDRPNRYPKSNRGRQPLVAVPGFDGPQTLRAWLRLTTQTLHFRAYHVHESAYRHLFPRREQCDRRPSTSSLTMADCDPQDEMLCRAGSSDTDPRLSDRIPALHPSLGLPPQLQRRKGSYRQRSGQALLEFAFLIPVLIILIGATISFGLFFYQANVLQQAVDIAAQEISRTPFPPNHALGLGRLQNCDEANLVSQDSNFLSEIYDEQYLVIHDTEWGSGTAYDGDFQAFADTLPLLNRLLVQVMVRDNDMTRYPGTLVQNSAGEETILIPIVEYRSTTAGNENSNAVPSSIRAAGETVCEWVAPVEEITVDHDGDGSTPDVGPYALDSGDSAVLTSFQPGMVALRINYPAQSTTLINRTSQSAIGSGSSSTLGNVIVIVGDTTLKGGATTGCYSIIDPSARISQGSGAAGSNPHAGLYGLGELEVLTRVVRPYRKVMTFQAIYRREVFSHASE